MYADAMWGMLVDKEGRSYESPYQGLQKLEVNSTGIETDWDHDGTRDVIAEVRRLLVISPALEEVTLRGRFTDFQTEGPPLLVDVSAFTKLPCLRKLDI